MEMQKYQIIPCEDRLNREDVAWNGGKNHDFLAA